MIHMNSPSLLTVCLLRQQLVSVNNETLQKKSPSVSADPLGIQESDVISVLM